MSAFDIITDLAAWTLFAVIGWCIVCYVAFGVWIVVKRIYKHQ